MAGHRVNQRAKCLGKRSSNSKFSANTHTRTDTLSALPGPLKWSVKVRLVYTFDVVVLTAHTGDIKQCCHPPVRLSSMHLG